MNDDRNKETNEWNNNRPGRLLCIFKLSQKCVDNAHASIRHYTEGWLFSYTMTCSLLHFTPINTCSYVHYNSRFTRKTAVDFNSHGYLSIPCLRSEPDQFSRECLYLSLYYCVGICIARQGLQQTEHFNDQPVINFHGLQEIQYEHIISLIFCLPSHCIVSRRLQTIDNRPFPHSL